MCYHINVLFCCGRLLYTCNVTSVLLLFAESTQLCSPGTLDQTDGACVRDGAKLLRNGVPAGASSAGQVGTDTMFESRGHVWEAHIYLLFLLPRSRFLPAVGKPCLAHRPNLWLLSRHCYVAMTRATLITNVEKAKGITLAVKASRNNVMPWVALLGAITRPDAMTCPWVSGISD